MAALKWRPGFFGDAATLTGTFDDETRIMSVDGAILVPMPPFVGRCTWSVKDLHRDPRFERLKARLRLLGD